MHRPLLVCSILALFHVSSSAISGAPKIPPRKADLPFIVCPVCQHLARNTYDQAQQLLDSGKMGSKVDEASVIDLVERATVSWKQEGEWITRLHLQVASGGALAVRDMGVTGECGESCKTIERAAEAVMGEHDTDVAEVLFGGTNGRSAFEKWMCHELTGACTGSVHSLPKDHKPYPAFTPRAADTQNVDRVLGEMSEKGLSGKMYTREELMEKYMGELGAEDDEPDPAAFASGTGTESLEEVVPVGGEAAAGQKSKVAAAAEKAKKLWDDFQSKGGAAADEL